MKKPGAGPATRLTEQQIVSAARQFFENGVSQAVLARELGISPSYMARRIGQAQRDGLIKVCVVASSDDAPMMVKADLQGRGQLSVAVDGSRVTLAVDLASAMPQTTSMEVVGAKLTVTVSRD